MMNETELIIFLDQKLAEIARALMFYYDCCGKKGTGCKGGNPNPCCIHTQFGQGLCPFSINNVCQFENAGCRLWLCATAIRSTDSKCVDAIKLLEQVGSLFGVVRRPFTGHPYTGADRPPAEK